MKSRSADPDSASNQTSEAEFYGCDPDSATAMDASSVREYCPRRNPLGIMLAPTGMLPVKSHQSGRVRTPHVPIDCNEIVEDVVACYELGVGAVHLHARDVDGRPSQNPDLFAGIIEKVRFYCRDIIIGVTTSGREDPSFEGRSRVLEVPGVDVASLTVTSVQFPNKTVVASEETIVRLLEVMHRNRIKPEFEFFDTGGINMVKRLQRKKCCAGGPIYCNIFLGNMASAQADLAEIARMIGLLPPGSYCGVAGFGGFQLKANTAAILIGGQTHVRTGLEDNIYFDRERKQYATNPQLVERIVNLARYFERPIATPGQMRQMMGFEPVTRDVPAVSGHPAGIKASQASMALVT